MDQLQNFTGVDRNPVGENETLREFSISNPPVFYPRGATIFAALFAILFVIIGVIGNLVTIVALWRNHKMRTNATTWFVMSLCFSDFLFCTINLPLTASRYIHQAWIFDDILCKIFPFFFYVNFGASLLNITLIALNRYVLISHYSLYDRIYQPCNVALMILFVWTFSFSMLIPPLLGVWGTLGLDPSSFSCTILKKNGKSPKKFLFIFGILIPCITIIFCYTFIFVKVRQSKRAILAYQNRFAGGNKTEVVTVGTRAHPQKRDDLRLTKMMFIIFATYMISFLPLMIFNVIDDEARRFPGIFHILASILAWASAVVNPFIYAVSNRQYRESYAKLLCCFRIRETTQNCRVSKSGSGRTFLSDAVQFRQAPKTTQTQISEDE